MERDGPARDGSSMPTLAERDLNGQQPPGVEARPSTVRWLNPGLQEFFGDGVWQICHSTGAT